ncbi:hypothetical protein F1C16_21930 (plasmid) [Hymenobacter sp. NBH84]|uniref:DUF6660 family protein n=1 Tax=Hymenobacter sp. NBH84 TaxID=2596915 RepID=UPI001626E2CC|nr:DUF6660 family protein [Hymenobacter sp. NBH84]QNE42287.1 hypothetical protein F1C16_21930 [Hymenobacter sp. NBH84]
MRLLSLFFAFYFACLSTLTCTDEEVVRQDQTQTTVAAASHAASDTDALGDWCSPLCQCHCCGGAVVSLTSPSLADYPPPVEWGSSPQHGSLVVGAPTRASGVVWQPPQA